MKPISTPQERLVIYKMALEDSHISYAFSGGLCILLNNIAELPDCVDYAHTATHLIELAEYHKGNGYQDGVLKYQQLYGISRREWRIKVLSEIINKIENNE